MNEYESIAKTRQSFETSFAEENFYNSQTQDKEHLTKILAALDVHENCRILDLGSGSGYLSFSIAVQNLNSRVVGLDIVSKTLENNKAKATEQGITNLDFVSYDGVTFPFEDNTFDIVVTRYALHHFPNMKRAFGEISRVLKPNGQLFLTDPTPNREDENRFVDAYMQLKDDGHIKFYTMAEFEKIANSVSLKLEKSFFTQIRFPRKRTQDCENLLANENETMIQSYAISVLGSEIWITEKVLNLSFRNCKKVRECVTVV